jgi:hypothetical protein
MLICAAGTITQELDRAPAVNPMRLGNLAHADVIVP